MALSQSYLMNDHCERPKGRGNHMIKKGDVYINDAYGKTGVSIDVDVDAGVGSIDLILK